MNPWPGPPRAHAAGMLVAVGLLLTALALGWHLLALRYRSGTSHPPYSSHRVDPLGCRVLHDALAEVDTLNVRRWQESARGLPSPRQSVLWVLGTAPSDTASQSESIVRGLEDFAIAGGRVVVALAPLPRETWASQRAERRASSTPGAGGELGQERLVSMRERWKFEIGFQPLPTDTEGRIQPATARRASAAAELSLSEILPCYTSVRFTNLGPDWQVVYEADDQPVVAIRAWGAGQICLLADAYPFSNEGLAKQPLGDLLTWLVGRRTQVLFNETHLGTLRAGGLASLARHYHLEGFLFGSLFVLLLLVVRLQSPLVPPSEAAPPASAVIAGLGSEEGLAALIQRTIPNAELPRLAFEEWQQSVGQHHPGWTPILPQLAEAVRHGAGASGHDRNPVATLATLTRIAQPTLPGHTPRAKRRHLLDLPRP